jgi:hypothetical protein
MNKINLNMRHLILVSAIIAVTWISISPDNSPAVRSGEINDKPQYEILQAEASAYTAEAENLAKEAQLKAKKAEALTIIAEVEKELEVTPQSAVTLSSIETLAHIEIITQEPAINEKVKIESYRSKYFKTSPISTEMIIKASADSGVPASFILAVGHNESHMGTKGRAVKTRNPMNVGNTDRGDHKAVKCGVANNCLNDWEQGLFAFTDLIKRCYFQEGEVISLQTWVDRDFRAVRCNIVGKRYMTDTRAGSKYQERINNLKTLNLL